MPLSAVGARLARLCSILKAIAPLNAGDEGWSVATTFEAPAREQITEGRAAPVNNMDVLV